MSGRHLDWSVAGYASHPVPGNADDVAATAAQFRTTVTRLSEAATGLRRLDSGDTVSKAVDEWSSDAREIAGLLELALDRYDVAADALATYGPELAHAQRKAEEALSNATTAVDEQRRAARQANLFGDQARRSLDPQEQHELMRAYHQAEARAEDAAGNLGQARRLIEEAIDERDRAADHAANRISLAVTGRELNDDLGDRLGELWEGMKQLATDLYESNPALKAVVDAVIEIAKFVWEHIDAIALGLTVLAFAVSWIPGVGQVALALAVLAKVAAAARALSLAKSAWDTATDFARGLETGDFSQFFVGAGTMVIGYGAGKSLGRLTTKVGNQAVHDLAVISRRELGTTRAALSALSQQKHTPALHPGALFTDALAPTSAAQRADALISTFKGSDYTAEVQAIRDVVKITQSDALPALVDNVVSAGGDVVESLVTHRTSQASCGAGATP